MAFNFYCSQGEVEKFPINFIMLSLLFRLGAHHTMKIGSGNEEKFKRSTRSENWFIALLLCYSSAINSKVDSRYYITLANMAISMLFLSF